MIVFLKLSLSGGVDMKNAGDALIYRTSGLIVLISSIVMIALMVTGGCGGNGSNTPPSATGFPPECGSPNIDLSCPAGSFLDFDCYSYDCGILDNSTEPPGEVDSFHIIFVRSCAETDCFSLECMDLKQGARTVAEEASITFDEINGMPVGEDEEGETGFVFSITGSIEIDGSEFGLDCVSGPVP
jgi:hypothetical protein